MEKSIKSNKKRKRQQRRTMLFFSSRVEIIFKKMTIYDVQ